jgi:excisionase family DNA binding protein
MEKPFMTVPEVARSLRLTPVRTYELLRQGRLPHIRRGRRVLIPRAAWNLWLAQQADKALASTAEPPKATS